MEHARFVSETSYSRTLCIEVSFLERKRRRGAEVTEMYLYN